jgi:hypothetical protein
MGRVILKKRNLPFRFKIFLFLITLPLSVLLIEVVRISGYNNALFYIIFQVIYCMIIYNKLVDYFVENEDNSDESR